jgi:3',5'-cyclic AMP phosphodiesterase CpdA
LALLLRYSNAEGVNTVGLHSEISSERGYVWWGWWKKDDEPFNEQSLSNAAQTATASPIRIGLVNRKDGEFYVGVCSEIRTAPNADFKLPCPEPDFCPSYYALDAFPAWFKFEGFEELALQDFEAEFGEIPQLDATLYEVEDRPAPIEPEEPALRRRVTPQPNWRMEPVETEGSSILHLSDLHFGEGHGFPTERAQEGVDVDRYRLVDAIHEWIRENDVSIGVVVISGDLISKGDSRAFHEVGAFLEELLAGLGLGKDHCVLVPGNHDLWTIGISNPTRTFHHQVGYTDFLRSFFLTDEHRELYYVRRYRVLKQDLPDYVFFALNSARLRSEALREYGYVERHRYKKLFQFVNERLAEEKAERAILQFAVLHHHLLPVEEIDRPDEPLPLRSGDELPARPKSLTLDSGQLIDEFQAQGIRFVLHGHRHMPFVGSTSSALRANQVRTPRQLHVLAAGSAGAKREWLPRTNDLNSFFVYTPNDSGTIEATLVQYADSVSPLTRLTLQVG